METLFLDPTLILIIAAFAGFFMAFGIGANDVANAMGTSVGSKAITLKQAIFIAAIFEFLGAYLAGGEVTNTIRKGIVDPGLYADNQDIFIIGMLSALLAAGTWLFIASNKGWPVSTTHSIVGAIVGFAAVGIGIEAVKWGKVGSIAASWVVSPVIAGTLAYALFRSVQKLVLDTSNPMENAVRYVPLYIFLTGAMISLVTMFKGLKHIGLELSKVEAYSISFLIGLICALIGAFFIRKIAVKVGKKPSYQFDNVERVFGVLMIFTACAMAFAHGSNDVANAIGPVAAIFSIVTSGGEIAQKSLMPIWILLLGGVGIVFGLLMYGHKVIATVGSGITDLTPSRGFCAELSASITVVIASGTGIPISTTHTLVGAVLGVGFARGISALNLRMIGSIFMSWVITLPAGGILAIIFFYILSAIFG